MLNEDNHIPLLNKAVRGLYPSGSTVKPLATLALQEHGVDPEERINCPGGYRLGNRYFRCDAVHGSVDMRTAIERSCNTYFWAMAHRLGYDAIAPTAKMLGLGQEFDLPGTAQRYGTVPDSAWKMRKYHQEWSASDSLNAIIGQGYVLVSPLQLAVMTARIASGKNLSPYLLYGKPKPPGEHLPISPEQFQVTREGMFRVVNGSGTAGSARIDINGVKMAGKTGTAQVRRLISRGQSSDWASRDHSLPTLCNGDSGRAWRFRCQRCGAYRQGYDDLPLRSGDRARQFASPGKRMGWRRHPAHGGQVRSLYRRTGSACEGRNRGIAFCPCGCREPSGAH